MKRINMNSGELELYIIFMKWRHEFINEVTMPDSVLYKLISDFVSFALSVLVLTWNTLWQSFIL